MMPYQEVHTLEVIGSPVDLTGAKLFVKRPCCNLDVSFVVTKCLDDDGTVRTYEMVPYKE